MRKLFRWANPYKFLIIMILLITILVPLTYSYIPQFIKYVVDIIFEGDLESEVTLPNFIVRFFESFTEPLSAVFVVGLFLLIFQFVRGVLLFINGYIKGKLSEGIAFDMRTKLYSHIQDLSYNYHNNIDTGDLIQRCTSDVETMKGFLSNQMPEVLFIAAALGTGIWQMSFINVELMLITLSIVPVSLIGSIFYFRYVRKKFQEIEEIEADLTTVIQENVNGVRVVKAFAKENYEIERFDKQNQKFRDETKKLNGAMALYWGLSDGLVALQYGATLIAAIFFARSNLISIGDIMAALLYISLLVYPIRGLGRIIGEFGKAIVAANRIDEVLSFDDEYINDGNLTPKVTGKIEFKDVTFKFDDTDKHLLNGINFAINPGETVAFIGRTGSGKSTIANILVRLLDYDGGNVLIDGVELKDISKHHIRSNIGIILQDPFLYAKSILENIRIANPLISEEKVQLATKTASVHNDIVNFNQGYGTLVGEKGVTLSGGQKQRLAIARMLVLEKPVLIFDDSLSAVDTKTDLQIRNALKDNNEKLTSIIITHRITTAKEADKIIVLEDGKVSAIGTHQELSQKPGLYKSLWDIQGALEDEFTSLVKEEGE